MAIRELDLPHHSTPERPGLHLVDPPPPRGRPLAALLVVVLVAGVLGTPVLRADRSESSVSQSWPEPPLSAAMVTTLDDGSAIVGGGRPTSSEPVGGMLFVRCTSLWSARPDGSHPHKLLDMTGVSSPTFSPDARSVAFFAPAGSASAIWLATAEGDYARPIARLTSAGSSVPAFPMNLSWSDNGKRLAFALVDPRFDPFGAGSSIWSYDLEAGTFERAAQGWPAPFFPSGQERIAYALPIGAAGVTFQSVGFSGTSRREWRLSSPSRDLTAAFANYRFSDSWSSGRGVVVLREMDDQLVISVKRDEWRRGFTTDHSAPSGYDIDEASRLALAQDGSRALVDLFDGQGERALGMLDLRSGDWDVLEYAWDGAASPAPTASGPLAARRAAQFANDLLSSLRARTTTAFSMLAADEDDREIVPFRVRGQVLGEARRSGSDWTVPASLVGKLGWRQWAARDLEILVGDTKDGRIVVDASPAGPIQPIETIEDAVAIASKLVGDRFAWPSELPEGARLNARWPLDAWSWDGQLTVGVNMQVPSPRGEGYTSLSVVHGDVGFSLGCGGVIDPEEGTVAGLPALFDQTGPSPNDTHQVLWPATLERDGDAFYTVYGDLHRADVTRIAESMVH
ncbi:MAG: hypothetical protein M3277_04015 [Actinomycetota bacterium]|nr:hypothetical protein [Actinomycetota bacterium]